MTDWGPEVAAHARWDWYQGTLFGVALPAAVETIAKAFEGSDVRPGRAYNGYIRACEIERGELPVCSLWWGGNPGLHVKASGSASPEVARVVRALAADWGWEFSPSRVDAAVDWIEHGLFDELAGLASEFARSRGVTIDQQGDWVRGIARTLYLGSRTSTVRLCLYEKGYQAGGDPDWVRFEIRVRPKSHARLEVARWQPADALGAATWVRDLVEALGLGPRMAHAVGTVWRPSDAERARAVIVKQYGRVLLGWFAEVGTWERLGIEIGTRVATAMQNHLPSSALRTQAGLGRSVNVARTGASDERDACESSAATGPEVYTEVELAHLAEVHSADDEA